MENPKKDFSLSGYFSNLTGFVGSGAAGQNSSWAIWIVGIVAGIIFLPVYLLGFIVFSGFRVTSKTWVYFIILEPIALIILLNLI